MRPRQPRNRRGRRALTMALTVLALLAVSVAVPAPSTASSAGPTVATAGPASGSPSLSLAALESAPLAVVPDAPSDAVLPGSQALDASAEGAMNVLVSFAYSNQSGLQALLTALSDPASPDYHHYLDATEFNAEFAPSSATYAAASAYFGSFGVSDLTVLPDRAAISFSAAASVTAAIFHDPLREYRQDGTTYVAPTGTAQLTGPVGRGGAVGGRDRNRGQPASRRRHR